MSVNFFFPHLAPTVRLWQDDCPACLLETGERLEASVLNNGYRACSNCHRVSSPQPIRYNFKGDQKWLWPSLRKAGGLFISEPLASPGHHEYTQYWPEGVVESNLEGLLINHRTFKTYLTRPCGLDQERKRLSFDEAIGQRLAPTALTRQVRQLRSFELFSSPTIGDRICFVGVGEMAGVEAWISLL